ncbi:LAMI_0E10968g1_1 [Lachancea mirantina]|uniref:LAMI_0E10968g1_1 n=1 Tax=Lachancea mirantina TaxID=1230905 RepID=A0A1G4JP99_9SACH|nr:LAMI_0E10968g1_1 [Lachancea mirantina]
MRFAVSTPSNLRGEESGYRVFDYVDGRILACPRVGSQRAEIDNIIQKFCYVKRKCVAQDPCDCENLIRDGSDYMFIGKSNGLIEVVKDFQFKVNNCIELIPNYILVCQQPRSQLNYTADISMVGLEYKDGLLYCSTCYGDLFIFALNLPSDYEQMQDMGYSQVRSDVFDSFAGRGKSQFYSAEELAFVLHSQYTGRTRLKHICHFLIPAHSDVMSRLPELRERIPCFQETIYANLKKNVSHFHINPLDSFSVLTVAPRTPLSVHKIRLPKLFVDFFIAILTLKTQVMASRQEQIWNLGAACRENFGQDLFEYLKQDSLNRIDYECDPHMWASLIANNGIAELSAFSVWRQKQGHMKDELHDLFNSKLPNSGEKLPMELFSASDTERSLGHGGLTNLHSLGSSSLRREVFARAIDAPKRENAQEKFLRSVRRNTFPVDFKIVETSSNTRVPSGELSDEQDGDDNVTSFFTDNYKDMDIVLLDKFLVLAAFRPKYIDEPAMKVDSFRSFKAAELSTDKESPEVTYTRQKLQNFSAFKKLFMINDSLCLIFDTRGVILLDRFKLRNCKDLLSNCTSSLKLIDYNIGLTNDIALIVKEIKICETCSDCWNDQSIVFEVIVTSVNGEISVLEGWFFQHLRIGKMHLKDKIQINKKHKFVDQIVLLDPDDDQVRQRKRVALQTSDFSKKFHKS